MKCSVFALRSAGAFYSVVTLNSIEIFQSAQDAVSADGRALPASSDYLKRAADIVGTDRLLFSTDFPYQYREGSDAGSFVERCGLAPEDMAAFASGNWERLTAAMVR
ncbi:hypothetical protein [Luteibacter sp. 3190]|uniref:hypothetical protein n=1 Tax=Luteibacter sp. 3190 TaxID=2817736 RepID=UPI0028642069|nr:hypothetical protein [Luteibacter sp. 3190]MDR6937893.1 putative TIM-barrel fold metal-dependent hydrolase [Luteibacter sp. 3190]